jgi:hypothetical protein
MKVDNQNGEKLCLCGTETASAVEQHFPNECEKNRSADGIAVTMGLNSGGLF